nr:MAG TPA: hypothetical protein [Bacteriophage sp.]
MCLLLSKFDVWTLYIKEQKAGNLGRIIPLWRLLRTIRPLLPP